MGATTGKLGGYAGRILLIDLSKGSISDAALSPELIRRFIGGAGVNARLAYDNIPEGVSPFSPENALVFGVGPLVGTLAPGACRSNLTSKSPTSGYMASSGSGQFGMLKFAGYDHLIITGKANRPVYINIDDKVEIRDAGDIWGKDTWESTDAIWHKVGRQSVVLSIGPPGENLVRDASIMTNKTTAFARTGVGAIWGSKNLKAIAVRGSRGVGVVDKARFMRLANQMSRQIGSLRYLPKLRRYGDLTSLRPMVKVGAILYKNFREAVGPEFLQVFDVDKYVHSIDHGTRSCLGCPVGCKQFIHWKEGEHAGLDLSLSCTAVSTFSAVNCGIMGWPQVLRFAQLCNRLGMDIMSTSGLVAMAMELYEKGIISESEAGGSPLSWDSETAFRLVHDIAFRRGLGDVLADGLVEAARRIGRGAEAYAVNFKGLTPGGDPRSLSTVIFSLVTNTTGHTSHINTTLYGISKEKVLAYAPRIGVPDEDVPRVFDGPLGYNIPRLTKWSEDYAFALECLGQCMHDWFQDFDIDLYAELYSAATGIEIDGAGLVAAASRGRDMRKAFNTREGATRKDDRMPRRFLSDALLLGTEVRPPLDEKYVDDLVTEYYEERGWNAKDGTVRPERLAELLEG